MSYFVPPSSLLSKMDSKKVSAVSRRFENTPLRLGMIIDVYEIDNEKNISKTFPEYVVMTKESNPAGGTDYKRYTNVISLDGFGGIADFFEYKLRPNTNSIDKKENTPSFDFTKQNGSMVIMLCLDGFSEKAIIIGGLANVLDEKTQRKTNLTKENGLHMEGEYNGINWKVNKDGEFVLTFKSPTDNNGKIKDKKYSGTFTKIDKTGSFEVKDKHNHVRMDNDKGGINITTDATQKTNADKNIELTAKADIIGKAAKWNMEITGAAAVKSASWSAEVSGEFKVAASGSVTIETSTTTIKSKQVAINANQISLGAGGSPAIILTTKFQGIGNLGGPVFSMAVGPFSKVVTIK
jgi:hypothetical protein